MLKRILCISGLLLAFGTSALAATMISDLGTAAPPATVGGHPMTAFAADGRPLGLPVTTVPAPGGGDVTFSVSAAHEKIGMGWATWSHGYTGDVYFVTGTTLTMTLPADTDAFYFYVEPNVFDTFTFTVTSGGVTTTKAVAGFAGANGFGIWDSTGASITSITVSTSAAAAGFAVGEFGIHRGGGGEVPEPTSLVLLGTGAASLLARRRRKLAQNLLVA